MSQRSVFCIAPSRDQADRIVQELKAAAIPDPDISALLLDRSAGPTPTAPADAVALPAPAATARRPGGVAGLGLVAVPGLASLFAVGPVAVAFHEVTAGGVAAGLVDFGVPQPEATRYEEKINAGGILLSVGMDNPDKCDRAREIFRAAGAVDLRTLMVLTRRGTHPEAYPAGFAAPTRRRSATRLASRNTGAPQPVA